LNWQLPLSVTLNQTFQDHSMMLWQPTIVAI